MEIIDYICEELNLSKNYILTKTKHSKYDLSKALSIWAYILQQQGYRHVDIGTIMQRERSLIYYYLSRHVNLIRCDRLYKEKYNNILQKINEDMIIE